MSDNSPDFFKTLTLLHARFRQSVWNFAKDSEEPLGINPKGDIQRPFDLAADELIRNTLRETFEDGVVLSEESGENRFGDGKPDYRFVVDPVDGSDNFWRGLPLSAVNLAVLPVNKPIHLDNVIWAMVGELEQETPVIYGQGRKPSRGTEPLQVSGTEHLEDAFISMELNHFNPPPSVGDLFAQVRAVRSYGCASRAILLVASGVLDAHVDIRSRLTPENYLAAGKILLEAGGVIMDLAGRPLGEVDNLQHRTNIIVSATAELAHEIIHVLNGKTC